MYRAIIYAFVMCCASLSLTRWGECVWQILDNKGLMRICGFFRCWII